ncbi:MAG: RNase adapter RapZ [Deltaproteobacteria bacterium]|nr:RNase adapter RapZ [Deltaproteobacteria bacterium]MBN2687726.1 RNase adapter RapZ [Deltaproteobacteria bacterium]
MDNHVTKKPRIVIVTGLSGSGKSTALRALEDIGFFCIDNLPVRLLPALLEIHAETARDVHNIALVMDIRGKSFLERHMEIIPDLKERGYSIEILFLDATDESLLHRFSETRRSHPLAEVGTVLESIRLEREKLLDLKQLADNVVDTSLYNVHELKDHIQQYYLSPTTGKKLIINVISFGYRHGIPPDADIVLDVRFLPNPYFVKELKELDGNNHKVTEYVMAVDETRSFLRELFRLTAFLTPLYEKEGKSYLNMALGCTGGKHRSVVIVNKLAEHYRDKNYRVNVNHRDIKR